MALTMLTCFEVLAGKRTGYSVAECIRALNNVGEEDLEKDEENAKSLLKLAMEGFSTRARTGDKKEIVSLLKFFRKVNENDKWLVAGVSQVLPSLHPFALKVLSRIENLGQKLQANASPSSALTVNRNLGSNERGEIGAELLELCVDYCDVNSKEAQRRVSVLAELAIKLLFFKPANPSDNDEACAMDGLKRAASFALSNVVESFPGTISAIYAAIQPKRKEFVQFMLRSPEASIQRSIIRVISILYNYKKDGRFAFVDIRATVAAFLRKTPRKSTESDAVLALFQKIDIADDNSFVQVDKFRGAAASFLDISPCLVTGPVVIGLVDSKHVSERKFTAASVDWDLNSFSVLHHRLKRLRIPWRGLMSAQWSVAGDSVAIIAEHSFLREIRVTFTSNRMQDKSDANRVYKILSQYKIPFTEVAFGREVGKPPTRKASSSQFQSTTAGTRPVHKPVVSQAEGTILGGLLNGDGLLSTASDELQVDNPPAETDGSGASREESIDVGIGPVVKTKQKPSAMKKAKSTTRQKSALNGAKQRQLRKKKSILDEDDDVPAKSRKRRLSWHDGQDGSVTQNSSGDGDGGDDSEEEDEDSDADMDDGSNVGTRDGDSSGSVSDSYFDDDMDDGHSEDGESEEEDDEELTAPSGSSLEEGSADSFVSMDDDGTNFRGKLLRIVEQRLKERKEENKRIIEEARKKLAKMDADRAKEDAANCAEFARFIRQEANKKKQNVAEWVRKRKRAIANGGRVARESVNLAGLDQEGAKLKQAVGKQLRECKQKLGTQHEMLGKTLGSLYESNAKRQKSANKSDSVFRGISDLLTAKDL